MPIMITMPEELADFFETVMTERAVEHTACGGGSFEIEGVTLAAVHEIMHRVITDSIVELPDWLSSLPEGEK